ncbi:beta-lactamase/transpeptidase-like protein, partial [Saccharata proteae CBS 121410]
LNETGDNANAAKVDSDSIFRIASLSKNVVLTSALTVANQSRSQSFLPRLTLDTLLRDVLPSFGLPKDDWEYGGSEITLSMLASESSGLPREGYQTDFNIVTDFSRASSVVIGNDWADASPDDVVENIKRRGLIFAPSQRPSYSNAGFSLLGFAVANYRNQLRDTNLTWSDVATDDILQPLNMTNSFFGSIPDALVPYISVPGTDNWVDLFIGPGYDPAGGMWSSANDLVKYIHDLWLKPEPELITAVQRRTVLQPRLWLSDGEQEVGPAWEITIVKPETSVFLPSPETDDPRYKIFGKSGDGGGSHSYIDIVPDLGYGIAVVSSEGAPPSANYTHIQPLSVALAAHDLLIPAFRAAYSSMLGAEYAGNYTLAGANSTTAANHALVELDGNILYLRNLVYNNVSALLRLDQTGWTDTDHAVFFSTPQGTGLIPSPIGDGQSFRMMIESTLCDYFDFDGYTDQNGWGLDRVKFVEGPDGMELHYPPLNAVLVRIKE